MDFLKQPDVTIVQALLLRFRPVNMDVLPLYIVLMLFLPLILWLMKWRADVTLALSVLLYAATWEFDLYLSAYPNGFWAFNPFAWQLLFVFGAWCALGGARRMSRILSSPDHAVDLRSPICSRRSGHADLVRAAARLPDAAPARAVDVSDQQDRSRRAPVRALPGAGGDYRALSAEGLARIEIALAAAGDPVRAAFAGDLLPRRVPGLRRAFRAGRGFRRRRSCTSLSAFRGILIMSGMAWIISWYKHVADKKRSRKKGAGRQRRYGRRELMKSRLGGLLGLTLLAGLRSPAPARAEEAVQRLRASRPTC